MFGGVGFLVNGNPSTGFRQAQPSGSGQVMACGVHKNSLIVRLGAEKYAEALSRPHVRVFDMTGHPMAGWIIVEPQGCASESDLKAWVAQGLAFARSLPGK
jgi:hypothetical protein